MTESRPLSSQSLGKGWGLIAMSWEKTQWYLKSRLRQPWGEAWRAGGAEAASNVWAGGQDLFLPLFLPCGRQCSDLKPQALYCWLRVQGKRLQARPGAEVWH